MAITFSLMAASRGRYHLLEKLIQSVFTMAERPEEIELWIMADSDDVQTHTTVKSFFDKGWQIYLHVQDRKEIAFLNRDYINVAVEHSNGKYKWGLGNDVEIVTKNWDTILKNSIESFLVDKPDRVCYVYVDDDIHKADEYGGCCFPASTKESVDALGFFMPAECSTWGADHWLWIIYKMCKYDRILQCREVKLLHHCHNAKGQRDEINLNVERTVYFGDIQNKYVEYVDRLNKAIEHAQRSKTSG